MFSVVRAAAAAVAVLVLLAVAPLASAAPPTDTSALREAVTVDGITEHQAALEAIANANIFEGVPTRATGTPGHEASVDYVVDKMDGRRLQRPTQQFEADIFFEQARGGVRADLAEPDVYQRYDGEDGVWYTADFSGDGDATAEAVAVDFAEPTAARRAPRTPAARPRTSTGRRHGQDRPAAARHLRLRHQGRERPGRGSGRRGDLQRGHDRRRGPQQHHHSDLAGLPRHDPGRRHRLRDRPLARRPRRRRRA